MARNALVTPALLSWARERIKLSPEEAAKTAGITVEKLHNWEAGESLPTINQAKKLAKKMRIPYVYFFLPEPPQNYKLPKNQDYRTFANQPIAEYSLALQYLCIDVMERRDVILELYEEMNMNTVPFEQYIDISATDNSSIAQTIRSLLELTLEKQRKFKTSNDAFNYYLEAFSKIGILVFQADKVEKTEMRGMSIYGKVFPIIVVNRKDEYNARTFTLFHELVHLLTRTPGICDALGLSAKSDFDIEIRCNEIAAEALVPQAPLLQNEAYRHIQQYGWDDDQIRKIARFFSTSREVIIGRLASLKIISIDFYNEKLNQYTDEYRQYEKNKKKTDGFLPPSTDVCSQVGKLYARTVINAYNNEIITPRDASHYLSGLRVQHFDKVERWCFS